MRSTVVILLALSASSVGHAQTGGMMGSPYSSYNAMMVDQVPKAASCTALVNKTLNDLGATGYGIENSNVPFGISQDGKTSVFEQDRIVSRETKGDVETVEYKVNQLAGYKDGKAYYEVVRKKMTIQRKDGQVVAITSPYDLKKQAIDRAGYEKATGKKMDYAYFKSMETTFRPKKTGGCETDQKAYTTVKDEQGNGKETFVSYDAEFCDGLKPMIDRVGANNAAECGNMITAAELSFNKRNKALKAEGKQFMAAGSMNADSKESAKFTNSTAVMSMSIALCVQEYQNSISGAYPGYGMYGAGSGLMMGGTGHMMGGMIPAEKTKAKSEAATR